MNFCFRAASIQIEDFLNAQPNKSAVIREGIACMMRRDEWSGAENKRLKKLLSEINILGQDLNEVAKAANNAALTGSRFKTDKDLEQIALRHDRSLRELQALLKYWKEPSDLAKRSGVHNAS